MTAVVDGASLPSWFVAACAAARTTEEAEQWLKRWRSLPPTEQERLTREQSWTLADWLWWLEPSNREWFWWDAAVESANVAVVHVQVEGSPAPTGALEWLLRAAGATEISTDVSAS